MDLRQEPSKRSWRDDWRLRTSWTERRNNDSLLEELGKQRDLMKTIKKRQLMLIYSRFTGPFYPCIFVPDYVIILVFF